MSRPPPRLLSLPVSRPSQGIAAARLDDARLIALTRAACAPKAPLRRPFLRGRWHARHVDRVAAAVAALAAERGDIDRDEAAEAPARIAERLRQLLGSAPRIADDLNSLAEFLGGRAASHADRLTLVVHNTAPPRAEDATPSAA